LKVTYGGPQLGKGAQVTWASDKPSVGAGSMEITESEPNHSIDLAVNFNGLEGTGSYQIVPDGSGSKVTWNFGYESGSSPLKRWKALMLDGFVGAEYSTGLERLKEKIESERRPTAPTVSLTPEGMPMQPGAPGVALPPGAVPPTTGTTPQGATLPPGQMPPGTPPAGGAAPAAQPDAAQPDAAPPAAAEAAEPEPAPAPAPTVKKKKRRQQ
jgi:hypothetical protein